MSDSRPAGEGAEDASRGPQLGGRWRKSSFSMSNGDCIEVASFSDQVGVRDSKAIVGPRLRFSPDSWAAFVDDIKRANSTTGRNPIL